MRSLSEEDAEKREHRWDLTPPMLAHDPLFTSGFEGNPFYAELVAGFGAAAAFCLWETARELREDGRVV